MEIKITYGSGEGPTELSAFDKALYDAGIADYNIIVLSSIIPEGAHITLGKIDWNRREHGYKLYAVLSRQIETEIKKEAWAGLGWIQDTTGKGLFVEHQGSSEQDVKDLIGRSLSSMQEYRSNIYDRFNQKLVGIKCKKDPVCALVCAVFKSESW
ncbi:MAG: pyruvoyl-dependent arginine decarboxylase [archaeon]|nr:pyruvoyl-dependent arginine decarboxylase [archaeon]